VRVPFLALLTDSGNYQHTMQIRQPSQEITSLIGLSSAVVGAASTVCAYQDHASDRSVGLPRHSFLRYVFGPPARPPWAASRACGGCRIASRRLHNPLNQVSVLQIVCRPFYVAFYVRCVSRERAHAVRATLHTIRRSRGSALPASFSRNKKKEGHIQWPACRIAAAFNLTFGCGIRL
jgi:hypothetical protein